MRLNYRHSEETKYKIGNSNRISIKKLWENPEYRKRMSDAHKGNKHTQEHKDKISASHSGEKAYQWKGGISKLLNMQHSVQ